MTTAELMAMTDAPTDEAWERTVAQAKAMEAKRKAAVARIRREEWSKFRRTR